MKYINEMMEKQQSHTVKGHHASFIFVGQKSWSKQGTLTTERVGRRNMRETSIGTTKQIGGSFYRRAARTDGGKWWRERVDGRKGREEMEGPPA
jgi:hypothetical protein